MAVWLLVRAVIGWAADILNYYVAVFNMPEQPFSRTGMILATGVSALLPFAVAVLLWRFSGRMAELVWRDLPETQPETQDTPPISAADVRAALFATLGGYLIVNGLPLLVHWGTGRLIIPTGFELDADFARRQRLELLSASAQVIGGVWLLLGTRQLVTWVRRLRGPRED
jgi:hypothetical protein